MYLCTNHITATEDSAVQINVQYLCVADRAALILSFTDTSSIKYCSKMYLQVQVPIPILHST